MNIAVIFAGGTGQRMNTKSLPKQFLELHGKPIIIYTLEHFENHPDIDGIVVACIEDMIPYLEKLLIKFSITKVKKIVAGGKDGQNSIYNALSAVAEIYSEDSIVLIHDGVRPLINEDVISGNIRCVRQYGNAITVTHAVETVTLCSEKSDNCVTDILDRSRCMMVRAPQSFVLKDILDAHNKARSENYSGAIDSAMLMCRYNYMLHTVECGAENIKITTPSDFYIFRAIIDARENSQIFG